MAHDGVNVGVAKEVRSTSGAYSLIVDRRERLSREGKSFSERPVAEAPEGVLKSAPRARKGVLEGGFVPRKEVPRERHELDTLAEAIGVDEEWFPDEEAPTGLTIEEACQAVCEALDEAVKEVKQ